MTSQGPTSAVTRAIELSKFNKMGLSSGPRPCRQKVTEKEIQLLVWASHVYAF